MTRRRVALGVLLPPTTLAVMLAALWWMLQAPRLPVPSRSDPVFRGVTLVEPGAQPRPGATLRIEGDRIGEITASPAELSREETDDTRDLAGLYVAPGLSDLHVHYPPRIAAGNAELWSLLLLAHGVTSIRETGSVDGSIFAVRRAIRAGRFPGPRIFACGAILDGEPPSFPSNRMVTTPKQARAAVAEQAERGADCIKVYNGITPRVLAAIREAAAAVQLPVLGHAPHAVPFEEAGLSDLQHGTGAVVVDGQWVGRMDFRAADWATVDDARIAKVARVSLAQDIAHTPTLVNGRMRRLLVEASRAEEAMRRDPALRHLPRFWLRAWRTIWDPPFVRDDARAETEYERFRERQAQLALKLHEAGVRIHAGTDTLMPFVAPGSSLHGELADLSAAGIPPGAVFGIATREASRSLGLPRLGHIERGAPADLVFLRSDPSRRIDALLEIEAVLADGRLYRRADLDAMLATCDAHFLGAFYTAVMGSLIALVEQGFAPERQVEPPQDEPPAR